MSNTDDRGGAPRQSGSHPGDGAPQQSGSHPGGGAPRQSGGHPGGGAPQQSDSHPGGGAQVPPSSKAGVGKVGESAAESFLRGNGYRILNKNFRCGKFGEIDIVASKSSVLCFVEVKARADDRFGRPAEAVNYKKRRKILSVASYYLSVFHMSDRRVRFDVVEVYFRKRADGQIVVTSINHIENAFTA
ncbi:MAG: YraN family protein [Clostridiales bacterium]|jgi:putative endonuclease|nr:YraN family protein [Clostridiales bacterium]